MHQLHWSIDSLCARDGSVFGYGWVFHPCKEIKRLTLICDVLSPAETIELLAEYGKARPDVCHSFPSLEYASNSGFLILGSLGKRVVGYRLRCDYASGEPDYVSVPPQAILRLDGEERGAARFPTLSMIRSLFARAWFLCRAGKFKVLAGKAKRIFKSRPRPYNGSGASLFERFPPDARGRAIAIVIDHDLGGGANQYRERYVASRLARGQNVLIYSFHVPSLSAQIIMRADGHTERVALPDTELLVDLLGRCSVTEILYNTGVSFARPENIPELLLGLQAHTRAKLLLAVHDFFMVCPSHFLLNYAGNYCGLPDTRECKRCLPLNQQGFATLFRAADIDVWRAAWGTVLSSADEVRCFSNDSKRLLAKAYPKLDESKITVIPHAELVDRLRPVAPSQSRDLRIGVIGQVGHHKGASVVKEMADEIARRGLSITIVVIGEIEVRCNPTVVTQTGAYQTRDLPDLIERLGVNVLFFPSIWPETFSYVIQEIMQMEMPVACFDWGAPAERVSSYHKGCVLRGVTAKEALNEIIVFKDSMYLCEAPE